MDNLSIMDKMAGPNVFVYSEVSLYSVHVHALAGTAHCTTCKYIAVLMIKFCLHSDTISDHAKFELTFTKVGTSMMLVHTH